MRSGNILQFSKSWPKMLVLLLLYTSLTLVAGKMGVSKEMGEGMLMFEEEEEGGNLLNAGEVKFDFKEVGSEDLEMINEEEEEGWKEKVDNDTADAKKEESDGDEQVRGGRSEESTGLSGQQIQEEEDDYQQDSRKQDLGLAGGHVQEEEEEDYQLDLGLSGQTQENDGDEEEERVFVSNTDPWLQYRYNFTLLFL